MIVTTAQKTQRPASRLRTLAFILLAALLALGSFTVLEGITEGISPWTIVGCPGCWPEVAPDYDPALNRWHGAEHGAMIAILTGFTLVALTWRPTAKPLLVQFYALGKIVFMGSVLWATQLPDVVINAQALIPFAVTIVLLALVYPQPRDLLRLSYRDASRRLLILTAVAAVALAYPTVRALLMQISGTGLPGEITMWRWGEDATVNLLLLLGGLLAASRRPGWRELGIITGIAYLFLGAAAITVPHEAASWGYTGGLLSLLGGAAYIGATLTEGQPQAG